MVERIMLFKLVDSSSRDELAALAQKTLSKLKWLEELSVGLPADEASAKSWDLSIVMGFATLDELNATLQSAAFASYLEGDMKGRYEVLKAWSFTRLG